MLSQQAGYVLGQRADKLHLRAAFRKRKNRLGAVERMTGLTCPVVAVQRIPGQRMADPRDM